MQMMSLENHAKRILQRRIERRIVEVSDLQVVCGMWFIGSLVALAINIFCV